METGGAPNFNQLRIITAEFLLANKERFSPFVDGELNSETSTYEEYCRKVASPISAVWGGQLELLALAHALQKPIFVFDAMQPVIRMNPDPSVVNLHPGAWTLNSSPIRLAFHRHFYSLGEHYNSVVERSSDR